MRFLAISGSLRAASANTTVLRAVQRLAPEEVEVSLYGGWGELPHFNPDLDVEPGPATVAEWRRHLRAADAVLISSPEYAHGVPGALKNALDWVVGSGEFVEKPVGLINVSPRATYAQASLTETLSTMMARVTGGAVQLPSRSATVEEIVAQAEVAGELRRVVTALLSLVRRDHAIN